MLNRKRGDLNIFRSAFILGGNSEIAQEICLHLVQKGTKKFHFVSRDSKKNEIFLKRLKDQFDLEITSEEFDLLKGDLKAKPSIGFYDLYIIAAGYLGNSISAKNNLDEALNISRVNYYSLIPWINSITTEDRISKPGYLWILSSVAGDLGRPSNLHYGAAKAAEKLNDIRLAVYYFDQLVKLSKDTNSSRPEISEAKEFLASNSISIANNV